MNTCPQSADQECRRLTRDVSVRHSTVPLQDRDGSLEDTGGHHTTSSLHLPHLSPAEQPGLQPRCLFPLALCLRDERERQACTCVFVIIVVVITRLLTTPTQTSFDSSRGFKARLRLECLVTVREQADLPAFFTW